jgi:hypothetical protein
LKAVWSFLFPNPHRTPPQAHHASPSGGETWEDVCRRLEELYGF